MKISQIKYIKIKINPNGSVYIVLYEIYFIKSKNIDNKSKNV